MISIPRLSIYQKIAFILGAWVLTQLAPGYLSSAIAASCPDNTSCVTRYDDEIAHDGSNGLNLRQAVGETTTSSVLVAATESVTIFLHTPLEILKNISIFGQTNSAGEVLVTIRPSETFTVSVTSGADYADSMIEIYAESATTSVEFRNLSLGGLSDTGTITIRAIEVVQNYEIPWESRTSPLLIIESVTIANAYADDNGGAILTNGDISISHSTFISNTADGYGGAIYAGGEILIENSTFINNYAYDAGGAVATHSSETIAVTNSLFVSNDAAGISGDPYAGGGAIQGGDGLLQVSGTTFSENLSGYLGGAILHFGDVLITTSIFDTNTAGTTFFDDEWGWDTVGSGGAIYVISEFSDEGDAPILTTTIHSSSFTDNQSFDHGGAIYAEGLLNIFDSHFENNTNVVLDDASLPISSGNGGAIKVIGYINVVESSFFGNVSSDHGGAIDIETPYNLSDSTTVSTIRLSDFRVNRAQDGDGGAIDGADHTLVLDESYFFGNVSWDEGGAIWSEGLVRVLNSDFIENFSNSYGGAIYTDSVQINQSLFQDNGSALGGGAINVSNDDAKFILSVITNSEFDGNVSQSGFGNALQGNAWLLLNSFVNYRSRGDGSVIELESKFGSISLGNSFGEQNAEDIGEDFCTISFNVSAHNIGSDDSCFDEYELEEFKSTLMTSPIDANDYLSFSDSAFVGSNGLLANISDLNSLTLFVTQQQQDLRLVFEPQDSIPTQDQIDSFESAVVFRDLALLECKDINNSLDRNDCVNEVWDAYYLVADLFFSDYRNFYRLYSIPQDAIDSEGRQFIQDYILIDQADFDRSTITVWTTGARQVQSIFVAPQPSITVSLRSSLTTEEMRLRADELRKFWAERNAITEAKKKLSKSLRLAALEKRKAKIAQMHIKMRQTQMRGEANKLKPQWQNLMKNFKR